MFTVFSGFFPLRQTVKAEAIDFNLLLEARMDSHPYLSKTFRRVLRFRKYAFAYTFPMHTFLYVYNMASGKSKES